MATKNKKETKAMTGAERVARSVKRRKDVGLIQAKVWVHPDEADAVRNYAGKKPQTKAALASL
ncbi:MAG: hypothetical protein K0U20_08720 [Proteobacteria bacterium]|nr:hypothetical protein [Pseudomonadota bacterium]